MLPKDIDGRCESDDFVDKDTKYKYLKTTNATDDESGRKSHFASTISSKEMDFFIEENIFSLQGDEVDFL
jgi:hypothetical protein